uniref:Uncharacterized protein n=1 Tax=Tetraselmis sp. GSL018 TaxID=582737 RepID=A0A061RGF2_9CHLO|eukprot:CAMPEP_0177582574 /NCGR_PEP_ID=MMETSP0419_2-20121207/2830_1 /TAXON_ID=582737 /ORGANISM="Tetraselmis sp., Strain GSL018" /LENGTH=50 /DNA_ID=CAMNT_0019071845 /DNA_START=189 /DNA_END=341 /DNA_ORIENTATION=+
MGEASKQSNAVQVVAMVAVGLAAFVTVGLWLVSNIAGGANEPNVFGRDEL